LLQVSWSGTSEIHKQMGEFSQSLLRVSTLVDIISKPNIKPMHIFKIIGKN
jgi:hypothetical protein